MKEMTTIAVSKDFVKLIESKGSKGETYETILRRLIL